MYDLRFRSIEREDLEQLKNWRNNSEIRSWTREYRLLNMENQNDWFKSMSRNKNNEMFLIEILLNNDWTPIGVCGLCYINWLSKNAEVSLYIGESGFRGLGLGKRILKFLKEKAFNELNLHKLWAEVYSGNAASMSLFEKAGYIMEGRLKQQVFKNGKYQDSVFFSLYRGVV